MPEVSPIKSPEFLIETILPAHQVHLLAGPSGAGKTRWIINLLKNTFERGEPIFGYKTHYVPWAYVAADRSIESVHRTFNDIRIDPKSVNIIPAFGTDNKNLYEIQDAITQSKAKLVVIEAFGHFAEDTKSAVIKKYLERWQVMAKQGDYTIIGVVESPKMKPNDRYKNPRWRVSGAAAWAHFADTIFLVEPDEKADGHKSARLLHLCPRHAQEQSFTSSFGTDGKLVFTNPLLEALEALA